MCLFFFAFSFQVQSFSYRAMGVSPGGFKSWQPMGGRGQSSSKAFLQAGCTQKHCWGFGCLSGLVGASVCGVKVIFAAGWIQGMACSQMKAGI